MLIEKDLKKIFSQLTIANTVSIPYRNSEIMVHLTDNNAKFCLTTLVYEGLNYIPPSVRSSLSRKSPFSHSPLSTSLSVDEQHYQIQLQYLGQIKQLTQSNFTKIIEDFGAIAEQWRKYLDDQDKNDLVYVRS